MNCIVNVDDNWGIGYDNQLLTRISADLKRFKDLTIGKTIILGRKTLETFPGGKPLHGRRNIVLTRDRSFSSDGADVTHSLTELFNMVDISADDVFVVGGESIYKQLLPHCNTVFITHTLEQSQANKFFPALDPAEWEALCIQEILEENDIQFQYITCKRKADI